MAGARVGYGLASDPSVAAKVQSHAINFAVSALGFAAAYASYKDTAALRTYLDFNRVQRERLQNAMAELGLNVIPSAANFVSVKLPVSAAAMLPELAAGGVYCGQWHDPAFSDFIRVGVGVEADNDRFISTLARLL